MGSLPIELGPPGGEAEDGEEVTGKSEEAPPKFDEDEDATSVARTTEAVIVNPVSATGETIGQTVDTEIGAPVTRFGRVSRQPDMLINADTSAIKIRYLTGMAEQDNMDLHCI